MLNWFLFLPSSVMFYILWYISLDSKPTLILHFVYILFKYFFILPLLDQTTPLSAPLPAILPLGKTHIHKQTNKHAFIILL